MVYHRESLARRLAAGASFFHCKLMCGVIQLLRVLVALGQRALMFRPVCPPADVARCTPRNGDLEKLLFKLLRDHQPWLDISASNGQ